ncbi:MULTISPECIES: helix-turn-helix domain-containing protein [Thauera]|uniref:Helix-turn-helix domain-containing protein n=1 Tax=Thauera sinica TaxID=2665146 RepID=A0ABW1AUK3_9RHOO|nr:MULTISPECIES: helix-turn-helix domain-containing protein [unclassified Thauera]ATE62965.1 transcriptional regulator [Thauera sp. K11]KAI5912220.1 helix-turn-helix domain-containing protein [Thauera sp. 2A1]KAI5915044.1 helix-turn-helix domain-containing protein [Thauera sp. 2A1]MBS0551478.1 helix-turn-helix domain-containing protein [Pseudomonadota bacterium]
MLRLNSPQQTGQILVTRRKALSLSQAAVAASLGISQNRLSELEAHPERFTLDRLLALASQLGLELVLQDKTPPTNESEW